MREVVSVSQINQLNYTQSYTLGLGLAHPNTYPIDDLLECGKGLVLWKDNHRISMTTTGCPRGVSVKARDLEPDQ